MACLVVGCGSSAPAKSNGEAAKPPAQILLDAAAALRSAGTYVLQGSLTQGSTRTAVKLTVGGPASFDFVFTKGPGTAEFIQLPGAEYVRANAAFWRSLSPLVASRFAQRWVRISPASVHGLSTTLSRYSPGTLGRCLASHRGTLSIAGTTTVDGRRAILIKDAGNVPGSTPTAMAVAATGRPYLLHMTSTGQTRPGGKVDVCHTGTGTTGGANVAFSDYGRVPAITAPSPVVNPAGG